ncbi:DUF1801 domain-containing protein [Pontixanthobacter aestiaquae]|uniref:DUF1801 domain-containing protein n=1 Tax=Pontixanthobacter aestiaquae TaxID=1509367 RepID=A0A844ZAL2_9SPHN|nr:DUF1801 domain-containing protein [Pontixanthobacter aestiaquae]MDN3645090.1 DUF1801 domain-containing protein [Pontixanthobacter aestiaquae]MXO83910.1 DUF1801 domain-containing protein [Pontixanthobacter aestiaquae]
MSEPKTKPTDVSVEQFIAGVEPEWKRDEAKVIDAMFRRVTREEPQMWGPSIIGYGVYNTTYASGRDVTWMRGGFSPRKAKHSLYLMGGYCDEETGKRRDAQLKRLGKHSKGKSCLYINKLADVDLDVLEEMIGEDWETMARIYPE